MHAKCVPCLDTRIMSQRFRVTNDPPDCVRVNAVTEISKYENIPAISHITPTGCHWYKTKKKTQNSNHFYLFN